MKVGDLDIYYETHGRGEALLLVAGLGNDLKSWAFQTPDFAKKYRVVTFDNRGSGNTKAPDSGYSIEMMADDTAGLMDALGIDRAHVLGVSMGGYVAQELALRHPERTKSLVLATTSIGPYTLESSVLRAWAAGALKGVSPRTFFLIMLPFMFNDMCFEDPAVLQMAVDIIAAHSSMPAHVLTCQMTACVRHNARGRIGRISVPTLVLAGKEDVFVPMALSEELASSILGARLKVLDGGGHGFNTAIPEKFNRAVLEFLARLA